MSSKVEQVEKNVLKITVEVEAERFEEALNVAFNKNKKKFKVNGFRPGMAPRNVVENTYGVEILFDDAVDSLLGPTYKEALDETKTEPVAAPRIDIIQIGKGKNLIYTAMIATKPEVELGEYKGVEIEKVEASVSDDEVEEQIKKDADLNARLISVEDRKTKKDDIVNIDFEGSIDGIPFEGGKSEGFDLTLGSNTFIDNFEDQLLDKAVNEEVLVKVKFPEDYGKDELNGKDAEFKVKINGITEKVLPEINDELAQDISEFDTMAEYKASVKERLAAQKEKDMKVKKQNEILEVILKNSNVEIPEMMIEDQVKNMLNKFAYNLRAQGLKLEDFTKLTGGSIQELQSHYRADAERDIKMALILEAIAKKESIEVSDADIDARLTEIAENIGKTLDEVKEMTASRMLEIKEEIVVEKTIEFLEANIKEK